MRLCQYLNSKESILCLTISIPIKVIYRHYSHKYGIQIEYTTKIGKGLYIEHFGSIVVNPKVIIGKNCNISHDVTIGQKNRGDYAGYPVLGNCIYIAPGAKIIGGIAIGNNVAIGANSVVTKDVPDNAVVVGVPGRIISYGGSAEYVNNVDYEIIP